MIFRFSYALTNYVALGKSGSRPRFLYRLSKGSKGETKFPGGVSNASKGTGTDGCMYKKSNSLINAEVLSLYAYLKTCSWALCNSKTTQKCLFARIKSHHHKNKS